MEYTRQQIEKMPAGDELNALIGEAFGFRQAATWNGYTCALFWPDYSGGIEKAWMAIMAMRVRGWYSEHTDLTQDSGTEWWSWTFVNTKPPGNQSVSAQAETPALAIWRAALLAILPQ